jgi:hypothetical protein
MDSIRDFPKSEKFWLWIWVQKHPKYMDWYLDFYPLPFFYNKGYNYKAGNILFANAWHQAKCLMMLSFAGTIAFAFQLEWYWTMLMWWFIYWLEGFIFRVKYEPLKNN